MLADPKSSGVSEFLDRARIGIRQCGYSSDGSHVLSSLYIEISR